MRRSETVDGRIAISTNRWRVNNVGAAAAMVKMTRHENASRYKLIYKYPPPDTLKERRSLI
jgi:hypothetical protein